MSDEEVVIEEQAPGTVVEDEGGQEQQSDERIVQEDHGDDAELNQAESEEEREAIRARRRDERKRKKEAQREREESLRRELASRDQLINEMRGRLDVVERKSQGADMALVDNELKKTSDAYNYYKGQIELAISQGNGAEVANATERMIAAQRRAEQLVQIKSAAQQYQNQPRPQPLDPRVATHAQSWASKNSWFNPAAAETDLDTRVALQVDDALAKEGWNPTTPQYWEELDARLSKYLPHRINSSYNSPQGNRLRQSPVGGSGKNEAAGSGKGAGYTLSAERVAAMKEAGIWDDPVRRENMIKRYKAADKQGATK